MNLKDIFYDKIVGYVHNAHQYEEAVRAKGYEERKYEYETVSGELEVINKLYKSLAKIDGTDTEALEKTIQDIIHTPDIPETAREIGKDWAREEIKKAWNRAVDNYDNPSLIFEDPNYEER